jgi:hypothetical protein
MIIRELRDDANLLNHFKLNLKCVTKITDFEKNLSELMSIPQV